MIDSGSCCNVAAAMVDILCDHKKWPTLQFDANLSQSIQCTTKQIYFIYIKKGRGICYWAINGSFFDALFYCIFWNFLWRYDGTPTTRVVRKNLCVDH